MIALVTGMFFKLLIWSFLFVRCCPDHAPASGLGKIFCIDELSDGCVDDLHVVFVMRIVREVGATYIMGFSNSFSYFMSVLFAMYVFIVLRAAFLLGHAGTA